MFRILIGMDKRFKLLFIILCFAISAFAQQFSVSGRVTDADGHPLDFANVFIVAPGDKIEASAVCDVDGKFNMTVSAGKCMLGCTFIGYEMYQNVIDLNSDIDVGDIKMQQSATELQTVVVQGRLMSVRMQKDGYSVDVSKINNDFNNALDLMRCIPQVQVKDNELKVAGKQQVLVKIGNVVQRVETSELPDVLKGYDARLVERVEVLRQPPLRYDKDGNTAMIVLHTTPYFSKYFGGIIGTEEMKGENYNFRYGGFGQLMYNTEKMFLSVAPSANWNGSYMKESAQYDYGSYLYKNVSPSKGDNNYAGVRGTLQWNYSKNGLLGLTGGFNKRSIDNVFVSSDWAEPQTNGVVDAKSNNDISFRTPKKTVTAYMEQTLGRPESKMWLETSYYDYTEKQNSDYVSLSVKDGKKFFTYNDKDCLKVRGVGVNNDYSLLLDTTAHNTTFDFGARFSFSRTDKDRDHNQWMCIDLNETAYEETALFKLDEYVLAPYASLSSQLTKKWWMRLGLVSDIAWRRSKQIEDSWHKTFVTWLPSLHTSFAFNPHHQLSFTLNSSVTQPKFGQLNPFGWRVNQKQYVRGNMQLKPEKHYDSRLTYTYNGSLSVSGVMNFGHDIIAQVTSFSDGYIVTKPENAQNSAEYGLSASYWFNRLSWLTLSVGAEGAYARYTSDNPLLAKCAESMQWGLNGYAEFVFNTERTFTGYVSGSYEGRRKTTVSVVRPQNDVSVGVTGYFLKRNLSVSLSGMNLLSSTYRGYGKSGDHSFTFRNRYSYPTLYLSVSYKFFNSKDNSPERKMSSEDVERRF